MVWSFDTTITDDVRGGCAVSSSSSSSSSPALPPGVRDSGLVPTQCLGLTVVVGGGGCGAPGAAVQVAWRAGRRQQQKGKEAEAEEAYFSFVVRVLPLIGVDAEAAARLENWLEDQVQQQLQQQARDERSMPPLPPFLTVPLKALTDCVLACRGKLDSLLRLEAGESVTFFGSAVARSAQASSYSALSWGGLVQRAVRIAGRRGTQALTPFDRWAEADNKHAAQEAEEEKEEEEEEEEEEEGRLLAPCVSMEDFEAAALVVQPSVSPAELRHYEDLRRRFCSNPADV
mmetsp:Transcript_42189/g.85331  ORF Transcript_42189/g.85331 Transcript_42189/m.85331 type:complete len:287 (-) Transcript_42189:96-956(-)